MTKNLFGPILILAAGALVTPAFATDVSCATSGTNQTLDAAAADPVIGSGNGCTSVNSNFQNFNVSGGGGSFPTVTSSGAPNIEFPTGSINSGPNYSLAFQTIASNTQGNTGGTCTGQTWCDTGSAVTVSQTIGYFAAATNNQGYYGITLSDGTVQNATLLAGNSVTVQENFCIGANTLASCSDPNSGYLLVKYSNAATGAMSATVQVCKPNASTPCTLGTAAAGTSVSFAFAKATDVAVSDVITLTTPTGEGRTIFLDSFTNTFDEAPEPSTFVLLGSAMVGLCALKFRRRKA